MSPKEKQEIYEINQILKKLGLNREERRKWIKTLKRTPELTA